MSGGTDSSVAAMLLQEAGYEVTGITFRFYEPEHRTTYLDEAAELAEKLNIKHIIFDAREIFEKQIIKYFVSEYLSGRTPFPCVYCNNTLKWPLLEKIATESGIFHIATGHYAQMTSLKDHLYIMTGTDRDKDQSFFLWGLPQTTLQRILFPLGNKLKKDVRKTASLRGFAQLAQKPDSMGICFCPGDYRIFLANRIKSKISPGHFVDSEGRILGQHNGYPFYTIGQRRGLIYLNKAIFVKDIDPVGNRVILSSLQELYKTQLYLKEINIVNPTDFTENAKIVCRIRYRKQQVPCKVSLIGDRRAIVYLSRPEHSIAPGQSAVFYADNRVLGGGIIENAE